MNTMIDRCTETGTAVFFYALKLGMREVRVQSELMERQQRQSIVTAQKNKKFCAFWEGFLPRMKDAKIDSFTRFWLLLCCLTPFGGSFSSRLNPFWEDIRNITGHIGKNTRTFWKR